jgi:hypothetical protein
MCGGVLSFFCEGLTPHSTITAIKSSTPAQEDSKVLCTIFGIECNQIRS